MQNLTLSLYVEGCNHKRTKKSIFSEGKIFGDVTHIKNNIAVTTKFTTRIVYYPFIDNEIK